MYIYTYIYVYIYIYICNIYIDRQVFRPSQDSSMWLGLTSREQLMSPKCSKHHVLSFAKMQLRFMVRDLRSETKGFCYVER